MENLTTKVYPKSKEDVHEYLKKLAENNAKKMNLTMEEYQKYRDKVKNNITQNVVSVTRITQVFSSHGLKKNWIVLKTPEGLSITCYKTSLKQKYPHFWGNYDDLTYAEKHRVKVIAFAYYNKKSN